MRGGRNLRFLSYERADHEIKGKYGRWLADFTIGPGSLVKDLLDDKIGAPYDGGKR